MEIIKLTREMFASGRPFAQGELRIWLKEFAPKELLPNAENLKEINAENGMLIVAHSETGHHHSIEVIDRPDKNYNKTAQRLIDDTNDLIAELRIYEESKLVHHRANDTHKAYLLPVGEYICRIDTEYTPDGYRKVMD